MSALVNCVRSSQLTLRSKGITQAAQFKCLHMSSILKAEKDYYEIKLKPFAEQHVRGQDKWRRQKCYPHHVDNVKWREAQGLPAYYNQCGPLTDNPDYSYVDETLKRPTTYGVGQRKRMVEQVENAKTIIQYVAELDHGKKKYQNKLKAIEAERQSIISSKLIPKGSEIL